MSTQKHILIVSLLLAVLTVAVFWQVTQCDFVGLDDPAYVTRKWEVQGGITMQAIRWAFTTLDAEFWHPLTWLSHMLDVQFFGLDPRWHHLTNLIFHVANTLLLFLALHRMTKALWQSAFVAALFALHPLHVESVVWVAERKDVLSAFFWMLTMGAYALYVERPGPLRYLLVLLSFVLGLMAKPMLITLPFALLLIDYWPLPRLRPSNALEGIANGDKGESRKKHPRTRNATTQIKAFHYQRRSSIGFMLLEKIPLFFLTVLFGYLTYIAQKRGPMGSAGQAPLAERVGNAFISYVAYAWKMLYPSNLGVFYPDRISLPFWQVLGSVFIILFIGFIAVRLAKRAPYFLVGWFWYVGTLVPVIGFVKIGSHSMADRYTYIPLIGLFIMAVWGLPDLLAKWRYRKEVLVASSVLIVLCFSSITWIQIGYWKNSLRLFDHAVKVTDSNYVALFSRGHAYADLGNYHRAFEDYNKSIEINPMFDIAYLNRGKVHADLSNYKQALADYDRALEINPNYAEAYSNRGVAYAALGKYQQTIEDETRAVNMNPQLAEAYYNRGTTYSVLGSFSLAIADYNKALEINPRYATAYLNRGAAYAALGKYDQAIADYDRALEANPRYAKAYSNRGAAYAALSKHNQAIADYDTALHLNSNYAEAYFNRAASYNRLGKKKEEFQDLQAAARLGHRDGIRILSKLKEEGS